MKEQINELIAEAERVGAIKIMAPVEWLRWQNERIEQLEIALKDIIEVSDVPSAVEEIARNNLGKEV